MKKLMLIAMAALFLNACHSSGSVSIDDGFDSGFDDDLDATDDGPASTDDDHTQNGDPAADGGDSEPEEGVPEDGEDSDKESAEVPDGEDGVTDLDDGGKTPVYQVFPAAGGVSARLAFEEAYDNANQGAWYRDANNENATLAWGESYVTMALSAMFQATASPLYLDRLAWHLEGVLGQRDDRRGVTDYRGVSGACWRNTHYQPNGEPYCYAVHSGMIASPLVEFALLVKEAGLETELAPDGETYGAKAQRFLQAAEQTAAFHDGEWNEAGYYFFPPEATFLGDNAGRDLPLNQSNAMGRLLVLLYQATGKEVYRHKAEWLAQRFKAQLTVGSSGEYLWNYWGGDYTSPGEDISHAAINVEFAVLAARAGLVFGPADLDAFASTFMVHVYQDDGTFSNYIGGGATNGSSYRPQVGRWLLLAPRRTAIYAAVRDVYQQDYPPEAISSGSLLLGWAWCALYQPLRREVFFYYVDWTEPDAQGFRQATAYGANVLISPPRLDQPAVAVLEVIVPRTTKVAQWDGAHYHVLQVWRPTAGEAERWLAYEPRWPYVYWNDGVLYEFEDSFVTGAGIRVKEVPQPPAPQITSPPPTQAQKDTPFLYQAAGQAQGARWWSLVRFPQGARIDHRSGLVTWLPRQRGSYPFTVWLQDDYGYAEQSFTVEVQ